MFAWLAQLTRNCLNDLTSRNTEDINFCTVIPVVFTCFETKITEALQHHLKHEKGKDAVQVKKILEEARKCDVNKRLPLLNSAVLFAPVEIFAEVISIKNSFTQDVLFALPDYQKLVAYRNFLKSDTELDSLSFEEHNSFPYASKLLKIIRTETMGRHVICQATVSRGDVLFKESSVASVVLLDYEGEYCHFCCQKIYDVVPCGTCTTVGYCSNSCKEADWKVNHCFECRYVTFLQSTGIAFLALRCIFSVGSYAKLKNDAALLESESKDSNSEDINIRRGYAALFHLEFHPEQLDPTGFFSCGIISVMIILFLKLRTNYFPKDIDAESLQTASKLLLKHILQLICNAHSIVIPIATEEDLVIKTMVATAIYPSASIMNHSCRPNIVNCFLGNTLVVRSAQDLEIGGSIFNCYGPIATNMNFEERQDRLMQQYGFKCQCDACEEPFEYLDLQEAFKCPSCFGPLILPASERNVSCQICGRRTILTNEIIQNKDEIEMLAKLYRTIGPRVNIPLEQVTLIWRNAREILFCSNTHLIGATQFLADSLSKKGQFRLAVFLLWVASKPAKRCFADSVHDTFNYFLQLSTLASQALADESRLDVKRKISYIIEKTEEELNILKILHYSFIESPNNMLLY